MKNIFFLLAALVLAGCATTYNATVGDKSLEIKTYREFPGGIKFDYDASTGRLTLEAGEVSNGTDVATTAIRDVVLALVPTIVPVPGE